MTTGMSSRIMHGKQFFCSRGIILPESAEMGECPLGIPVGLSGQLVIQ
jgi:hypothetical protein